MNIWKYMKSNKVFFLLSLAAAVLGTLASFLMGGCTKKSEDQNRVIASKRVKVNIKEPSVPAGLAAKKKKTVKAEAARAKEHAPTAMAAKETARPAVAEKPAQAPAPRVARAPAPRPVAKARPSKKAQRATARKTSRPWAVNVASFTHGRDAEKLRKLLISLGYNAYMTKFVKDGTLFYRIRVGFYPTREEAAAVGRKIAAKYRYVGTPWAVKPGRTEVASHIR
jgi:cell division septation protein DedD